MPALCVRLADKARELCAVQNLAKNSKVHLNSNLHVTLGVFEENSKALESQLRAMLQAKPKVFGPGANLGVRCSSVQGFRNEGVDDALASLVVEHEGWVADLLAAVKDYFQNFNGKVTSPDSLHVTIAMPLRNHDGRVDGAAARLPIEQMQDAFKEETFKVDSMCLSRVKIDLPVHETPAPQMDDDGELPDEKELGSETP